MPDGLRQLGVTGPDVLQLGDERDACHVQLRCQARRSHELDLVRTRAPRPLRESHGAKADTRDDVELPHGNDDTEIDGKGLCARRDARLRGPGVVGPAQSHIREAACCYAEHEAGPGAVGSSPAVAAHDPGLHLPDLAARRPGDGPEQERGHHDQARHTPSLAMRATRRRNSPTGGSSRSSVA